MPLNTFCAVYNSHSTMPKAYTSAALLMWPLIKICTHEKTNKQSRCLTAASIEQFVQNQHTACTWAVFVAATPHISTAPKEHQPDAYTLKWEQIQVRAQVCCIGGRSTPN